MKTMVAAVMVTMLAMPAAQASPKDEETLKKAQEDFAAAWAKDDAKAMAAFFADDADLLNPAGRMAKGRAEIEKLFADEHTSMLKGSTFAPSNCMVRFLKPDVAAVTCDYDVAGAKMPDGKPMPLKGSYTMVSTKKGGKWLIAFGRAMAPPPPPPAGPPK